MGVIQDHRQVEEEEEEQETPATVKAAVKAEGALGEAAVT